MEGPSFVSAIECTVFVHSIFHCFHLELYISILHFSRVALYLCHAFLMLPFFLVALFSCYSLPCCTLPYCILPYSTSFMLHSFQIVLFPYCAFFLFHIQKHPDIKFCRKRILCCYFIRLNARKVSLQNIRNS